MNAAPHSASHSAPNTASHGASQAAPQGASGGRAGHAPEGALASLPPPLRAAALQLRSVVRRLPVQPPSFVVARLLDQLLWPRLDEDQRRLLADRCVEVEVVETGIRVRLVLGPRGFQVARASAPPAVKVRAQAAALWRLVRGEDDADRLFFERALVMEGDTEYGLVLKNTLDAIGPLWR
ncbi:MAG: SCP2 sterol-binding domain-containing protein [Burkholderiales bacterium]|nr:SCP2 sterol-binding domain-containing protein [Burkholderiales bacterium]